MRAAGTYLTHPRILASGHKWPLQQTHFPLHCLQGRASSRTSNRLSTVTAACSCQPPQHYVLGVTPSALCHPCPVPWLTAPAVWASCRWADEGRLLLTQDRGPCPSLCVERFTLGTVTIYKSVLMPHQRGSLANSSKSGHPFPTWFHCPCFGLLPLDIIRLFIYYIPPTSTRILVPWKQRFFWLPLKPQLLEQYQIYED